MSTPASERPVPRAAGSWFDAEDAPGKRALETCIHCGLCLTACPTYRELKIEPDSPRGRIYLMRGLAEGRIAVDAEVVRHLDQCLGCRACESVCPAGVPYGRMLEETRGQLERRARPGSPGRTLGTWALEHLVPHRERMHLAMDLLRLTQQGPLAALLGRDWVRRLMPESARRGLSITPPLAPRDSRRLEHVARALPPGARFEDRPDALVFHPAGAPRAKVGFFTTCVMETMFPEINREAVRLLVLAGARVVAPRAQTCCGALHAHAGLRRDAKALARRNVTAFGGGEDYDFIVTDSAGCGAALREYGELLGGDAAERGAAAHDAAATARGAAATAHDASHDDAPATFAGRVRDVSEVLDQLGLPEPRAPLAAPGAVARALRIGYHDPCHLAHAQNVRAAPRRLLRALPGVELVDLPHSDWCCGSAGVYNLTHPEMANAQLAHKLDAIAQVAPDLVVASNPGCMLHIARGAIERGIAAPVVHLVQVLSRAHPPEPR